MSDYSWAVNLLKLHRAKVKVSDFERNEEALAKAKGVEYKPLTDKARDAMIKEEYVKMAGLVAETPEELKGHIKKAKEKAAESQDERFQEEKKKRQHAARVRAMGEEE